MSTAVLARSYSRHSRVISCEAVTANSGKCFRRWRRRRARAGRRVAVQELDGDRLDSFGLRQRAMIGSRSVTSSGATIRPFASIRSRISKRRWRGTKGTCLTETEIVKVGPVAAADLQHVAKASGGNERRLDALAFGDGVDHRGAAMDEKTDLAPLRCGHFQRAQHALGQITGRCQRLLALHLLGLFVVIEEVGEGPADVDR